MDSNKNICPKCGDLNAEFNQTFGFYVCSKCGETWAFDEDDPDYDEEDYDDDEDDTITL